MAHTSLLTWVDRVRQDSAYAWRGLRRSPGFTATVVLTLGLGLGVNVAMFSLLDRLFVRAPHGVVAPSEIRRLYFDVAGPASNGRMVYDGFIYPHYRAIAAAEDTALRIAAYTSPESTLVVRGAGQLPVRQSLVTGDYFRLLGVRPQLGRFFVGEETHIEAPTLVAVLSDALWRREFGADTSIIGKTLYLNFRPHTVVGIAPNGFSGIDLDAVDVWAPANSYWALGYRSRGGTNTPPWYEGFQNSFGVIVRVPNATGAERVLAIATRAIRSVHLPHLGYDSTSTVRAGSIVRTIGPGAREQEVSIATRLAGVAVIVLLIACSNVANLLLVRAAQRRREIAVRCALGVSRGRLCAQLLTESVMLAMLGGVAALAFAFWAATALRRLLLPNVQWADAAIDLRTLAFAALASVGVGVLAGLAPVFHATRPDLTTALKAGARDFAYQQSKLRSVLLVGETALSIVLLVGAGLFVRSLNNVRAVDVGYDVEHMLLVRPLFGANTPPPPLEVGAALPIVVERLASAPGVEAIAYATAPPMRGATFAQLFLPGRDALPKFGEMGLPWYNAVSPGYLRAAGVKLLAGREFTSGDRTGAPGVLVVSRTMARVFWPGEAAIGKCVIIGERTNPCSLVVGVAADVHGMRVLEGTSPMTMQYYRPSAQVSGAFDAPREIVIRTSARNIGAVSAAAAQELRRAFPTMTTPWIRSMNQSLEPQFRPWRLGATLFTAFGVLALVVAAIGVYSVIGYAVTQRTHEMGIRIALGARLEDIVKLVVRDGFRVVAFGVGLGIAIALAAGRLVASLLYGLSAHDPLVMAGAVVVLSVFGIVASLIPALRAGRVDPIVALRAE